MRVPRFWKDTGAWNDQIISLTIAASTAGGLFLSSRYHSLILFLASLILGPIMGFFIGFFLVLILVALFGKD
jgi:hypothetical protein